MNKNINKVETSNNQDTNGSTFQMWSTFAASALTFVAVIFKLFFSNGDDYTKGFAPTEITALTAILGIIVSLLMIGWNYRRLLPRFIVLIVAWGTCILLIWSSGGIIFDVLRTVAILGTPGLPPIVDWIGFATRAISLMTAILLALTTVKFQHASRDMVNYIIKMESHSKKWFGYAAFVLSLPYPLLKIYLSFGGSLAGIHASGHHAAYGEIVLFGANALLSLALVQKWGRIFPRWILLVGGWTATCATVPFGFLAIFGSLMQLLGFDGPIPLDNSAWLVALVYGEWLFLGITTGAATWIYQQETQSSITQKRKHS
ncbi:hypothetical protein ACFQZ1_24165 [Bacillus sp. CGMCC 1.60114]|uniref:hypothetical protein n=1 Tax=unclassified Bacillus (in: firmicutes) TaxID=185979 RepID=UPI0036433FD6